MELMYGMPREELKKNKKKGGKTFFELFSGFDFFRGRGGAIIRICILGSGMWLHLSRVATLWLHLWLNTSPIVLHCELLYC